MLKLTLLFAAVLAAAHAQISIPFPGPIVISGAAATPAFVQAKTCNPDTSSHTSITCTLTSSATAGNALFVATAFDAISQSDCETTTTMSVAGGSNTYTQTNYGTTTKNLWYGRCLATFSAFSINSGSLTITVTYGNNRSMDAVAIMEISGSTATDASATGTATSTSVTSGAFTTTVANELIVAVAAPESNDATPYTAGAIGGTTATIPTNGSITNIGMEYRIVSSTQSSITAAISWTGGTNAPIAVLSFK